MVESNIAVGQCADPETQGVVSAAPTLERADRDLDGDGIAEVVVVDRALCTREGNCHWNLYRVEDGCRKYLGTVSASAIQRLPERGEQGFFGLRGYWTLTSGRRMLLQEYRFVRGGYRLIETLLCRQADDDRIVCAEPDR